jgi:hypothetical protein
MFHARTPISIPLCRNLPEATRRGQDKTAILKERLCTEQFSIAASASRIRIVNSSSYEKSDFLSKKSLTVMTLVCTEIVTLPQVALKFSFTLHFLRSGGCGGSD